MKKDTYYLEYCRHVNKGSNFGAIVAMPSNHDGQDEKISMSKFEA